MKKSLNILAVTPYFYPFDTGGVPMHTYNIYKKLSEDKKYKVQVITSGPEREVKNIENLKVTRLKYWFKLSNTPINPLWFFEIKNIVKKFKPDAVMLHTPVPFISDMAALATGKIPFSVKYHNGGSMKKGQFFTDVLLEVYEKIFLRLLLSRSKVVISASDYTARGFLKEFTKKTVTITPGVDINRFKPVKFKNTNQIFFLGSLNKAERYKGLEYLILAMPTIIKKIPDAKLVVVSPGNFQYFYEKLAHKNNVSKSVFFMGKVVGEELVSLLKKSSVVCLPSPVESCPNIILEGMASGKPIVGSKLGGIADLVKDGEEGLLVSPKDPKEIAAALIKVLSNRKLAIRLGKNGRKHVVERYTWEKKVAATKKVIDSLIK